MRKKSLKMKLPENLFHFSSNFNLKKKDKFIGFWKKRENILLLRRKSKVTRNKQLHSINREKKGFCKQMATSQILCKLFYLHKELAPSSDINKKNKTQYIYFITDHVRLKKHTGHRKKRWHNILANSLNKKASVERKKRVDKKL